MDFFRSLTNSFGQKERTRENATEGQMDETLARKDSWRQSNLETAMMLWTERRENTELESHKFQQFWQVYGMYSPSQNKNSWRKCLSNCFCFRPFQANITNQFVLQLQGVTVVLRWCMIRVCAGMRFFNVLSFGETPRNISLGRLEWRIATFIWGWCCQHYLFLLRFFPLLLLEHWHHFDPLISFLA